MLSLIRKFAGHSISSSINIHHLEDQVQVEDNEQSGDAGANVCVCEREDLNSHEG